MDKNKIDKYWKLLEEYYQKAPDSQQMMCGYMEWDIEFNMALQNFEKGMTIDQIRRVIDDVFTEMLAGSIYLDPISSTIMPVLIHDWLNEVENPRTVDDYFGRV